ncbi:MAG TPA: SpoIID/LytB domain-containing protein [Solirubrobacteraceae bacterium]|nr:SpoIID/LytB domain-containing protein [Solirubrobacteraceae bacterium]
MRRISLTSAVGVLTALAVAPVLALPADDALARSAPASGAGTLAISGGGFGHGIGMSQYGAMGFALHGWSYPAILGHYYAGTQLARVPDTTVTVLLGDGTPTITGATRADGHALDPSRHYGVIAAGGGLELISGGRRSRPFPAPLELSGPSGGLTLLGKGAYEGSLRFYPDGSGGVQTVNAVDLEDYVRGVVAEEMPASWPQQALDTQAVAARTYVLADTPVSPDYEVYSDTRSQMYGGIGAETPATNAAVAATLGQVVQSGGQIVPTYFSASSGGHTESIQNVWLGVSPAPYLVGVPDPYDDAGNNPYYRWHESLSLATAQRRLAGLFQGSLRGIRVLSRGVSPRIVSAQVVGTRGSSTVSGATLESDLGTYSSWMSFTTVTAHGTTRQGTTRPGTTRRGSGHRPAGAAPAQTGGSGSFGSGGASGGSAGSSGGAPSSGGAGISSALARMPRRSLSGTVFPARAGATVIVARWSGDGWVRCGRTHENAAGTYRLSLRQAGRYRVLVPGPGPEVVAPAVRVR